ncbi:MAG: hypothetical protein RSF83_10605, partial [Hungatella sp.]
EADYNHSFWLDILISYVVGVTVREDRIEVEPLHTHLSWFQLENLQIQDHRITIRYSKDKEKFGIPKGLTIWVDEKKAAYTLEDQVLTVKLS